MLRAILRRRLAAFGLLMTRLGLRNDAMKTVLTLLAALACATPMFGGAAHAHEVIHGALEVIHPNIPKPPKLAKAAAGYMALANNGDTDDRLVAIETKAAKSAQIHNVESGDDGIARMVHVPVLDLPAGETILFEQGSLHVMLMGLEQPLNEGDMIPVTLVFEHAGPVEVEFMVDPQFGAGDDPHAGHAGHAMEDAAAEDKPAEDKPAEGHQHH